MFNMGQQFNPQQMMMQQMQQANPQMLDIFQVLKTSSDPKQLLMSQMATLANVNPQMAQIMQMVQGKSGPQLQQLAQNLYASSGADYNTFQQNASQRLGL